MNETVKDEKKDQIKENVQKLLLCPYTLPIIDNILNIYIENEESNFILNLIG
jgi:hypothetical protein